VARSGEGSLELLLDIPVLGVGATVGTGVTFEFLSVMFVANDLSLLGSTRLKYIAMPSALAANFPHKAGNILKSVGANLE